MPPPPRLRLGVCGLSTDWEVRYAPALARLAGRVQIAAVYDAVARRAAPVAAEAGAPLTTGVRATLERAGLSALLVLDWGWQQQWMLQTAARCDQPFLLGQNVLRQLPRWDALQELLAPALGLAVPECLLRYQPSVLRMRELLATQLGDVREIRFWLPRAQRAIDHQLALREVANWFLTTFKIHLAGAQIENLSGVGEPPTITLTAPSTATPGLRLRLAWAVDDPATASVDAELPFCELTCQSGAVSLLGGRRLQWHSSGRLVNEQLDADRTATDVALDLFARRALGGLIPVPALSDLSAAQQLADQLTAAGAGDAGA